MEHNAFSIHSTEERNLGTLLASGLTCLVPISSGSAPYCLETEPAPTPHTCTQHAHHQGPHSGRAEPHLRREKTKSQRQPRFLALSAQSTWRHTKGQSFFYFLHKIVSHWGVESDPGGALGSPALARQWVLCQGPACPPA